MIEASVILDSIAEHSPRLHTQFWRYPKFVHQESLRHRKLSIEDALADLDFSFSVSSARAIPVAKVLEEVRSDDLRAKPVLWGSEQRGMVPGAPHDALIPNLKWYSIIPKDYLTADELWGVMCLQNADIAEALAAAGYHKSHVNRCVESGLHVNCVVTGCHDGWMNWFGLRLDGGADPTLRALAEKTWAAWKASEPRLLRPGEWHLPFADPAKTLSMTSDADNEDLRKISAARCARTSYLSFDTGRRSTVEEDLRLYDKLAGGPIIHASPMEHQAMPDEWIESWHDNYGPDMTFRYREQHGNLPGWIQFRKLISGEAVAPLPIGYQQ